MAPRFSLVVAVHNVHRYLPDFIASVERQTFDLAGVQVVVVDDGSTDDSLALVQEWAARSSQLVTVLTQANAGQGAARNAGLDQARGEWISFPDPDDLLDADYLAAVDRMVRRHPDAVLAATSRLMFLEATDEVVDTHPMRRMFLPGDQLVDLDRFPEYAHNSVATAFFRADVLGRESLRFDPRVRPVFEDGHFCSSYLLACERRLVAFVQSARYSYRKRADNSSTLQNSLADPDRYLAVPRYGYLDVLTRGAQGRDYAPEWLQNMVLYDISYYFSADLNPTGETGARGEVAEEFLRLLAEIATRLDPIVINSYAGKRFDRLWRDILLHSFAGRPWVTDYAVAQQRDDDHRMLRVAYRYVGPAPQETVLAHGLPVDVEFGKVRSHEFFGATLMHERVAWVPLIGSLRIVVDGVPLKLQLEWEPPHATTVRPVQVNRWFDGEPEPVATPQLAAADRAVVLAARTPAARSRFRDAWVLMDRIHDADDNAERLFRYLRAERTDINAWFVLERGTPDWDRLVRDGFGGRLVAHGSRTWKLLMLNCAHLISSHADRPVHLPPAITRLQRPTWKFTFLQHGVIREDVSRRLNPEHADLMVTSTPQEHASIVGDGTPYAYTAKEARMTGLPRFDRLRDLGARVDVDERAWILVCPTWRHWLAPSARADSQRRDVAPDFLSSDYVRQWGEFLHDERLRDLAERHDLRIGFLPHPNLQPALPFLDLPPHVEALTFSGTDVQQLIADTVLMVTDYSSLAFDAAYLDRPVVYLQFDADRVGSGAHIGRPGYFSYERDGFGPVTVTTADAVAAVEAGVTTDSKRPTAEYQHRIDRTFPQRDGRCCERTTAAIESLTVPRAVPSLARRAAGRVVASQRVRQLVSTPALRGVRPQLRRLVRSPALRRLVK